MATKRRKVWLAQTVDGLSMYAMRTKADAKERAGKGGKPVPFTERLPGDVVRTKDEEVALKSAIDRYTAAWETAYATHTDESHERVTECGRNLRALLRGRR